MCRIKMRLALSLVALLGQSIAIHAADKVPVLNVEPLCKATVEDDKANGIADPQDFSTCMDDEKKAQKQVGAIWATSPSAVRNQCETTATIGGNQSYVDLLTCLQAEAIARSVETPAAPLRGASQNRNKH
jgi:hypothetical protein